MSSLADIVAAAHGRAGKWHVTRVTSHDVTPPGEYATLYHYTTPMLTWRIDNPTVPLHLDTGHGSVSDQAGMNQAFRILGMPLYYSRAGGAELLDLPGPPAPLRRWRRGRGMVEYVYAPKGYERVTAMDGRAAYERTAS